MSNPAAEGLSTFRTGSTASGILAVAAVTAVPAFVIGARALLRETQ